MKSRSPTSLSGGALLGIDVGSGGVKATLLALTGEILATSMQEYPTYYPRPSWAEQNPQDWIKAVRTAIAEVIDSASVNPRHVEGISVDAATHTAVLLDDQFQPLDRAILWTDRRSQEESRQLSDELGSKIFQITYHRPDPIWTLPHLRWIRSHRAETWSKARRLLFTKDYVRRQMTGDYLTDRIEALGSMLLDARTGEWSEELCMHAGFPRERLPPIREPVEIAGTVLPSVASTFGLTAGTPVAVGSTDTAVEMVAAGAVTAGSATLKIATAGRICVITDHPIPHTMLVNYPHVISGLWYPGIATKSAAASFRWFRDTFAGAGDNREGYAALDERAEQVPIGCEGLIFHPYLSGELSPYGDPALRASFTGISMHHGRDHFARAVLEGVAYSLRDAARVLEENGVSLERARIIGGGSKSRLWRRIVADCLGVELELPAKSDSSLGSAILAGVAVGAFSNIADGVEKAVRIEETITPVPACHEEYSRYFDLFAAMHDASAPVYHQLSEIERRAQ